MKIIYNNRVFEEDDFCLIPEGFYKGDVPRVVLRIEPANTPIRIRIAFNGTASAYLLKVSLEEVEIIE